MGGVQPTYLCLKKQRFMCKACVGTITVETLIFEKNCFISKNTNAQVVVKVAEAPFIISIALDCAVSTSTVQRLITSEAAKYKPHHKSAVITLVEYLSKVIFTLKPNGRKAKDIETNMNQWFQSIPRNLFKFITFDCGKEFSNWKTLCNLHDIAIYFADPGTPSQRALNENSNGLLRKDGLPKEMDFNLVDQAFVSSIAHKRNKIPRKSLNYQTPLEILSKYVNESDVSSLY